MPLTRTSPKKLVMARVHVATDLRASGNLALDAEISAEPSHDGICLTITRHKTRRIWIARDEIPIVIAALKAHVAPVTVRRAGHQRGVPDD